MNGVEGVKSRWIVVAGVLVVLTAAVVGIWIVSQQERTETTDTSGDSQGTQSAPGLGADAATLDFAPPDAVGAVHVECRAIFNDAMAELARHRGELAELGVDLDALKAAWSRVVSWDMFFSSHDNDVTTLTVLRGRVTLRDATLLLRALPFSADALPERGNGRYQVAGDRVIVGDEADDLTRGVILAGDPKRLTPELVAALGTGTNANLRAMLKDVTTSAPLWVAMSPELPEDAAGPRRIVGWFEPGDVSRGKVDLTFRSETYAQGAERQLKGHAGRLGLSVQSKRSGNVLTVTSNAGRRLAGQLILAMLKVEVLSRRLQSQHRLEMIHMALVMYKSAHKDLMPPELNVLTKRYLDDPRALQSPVSTLPPGSKERDYIYLRPPGRMTPRQDMVLLYERPENHVNTGTVVLFGDGRAEWVPADRLKRLLRKTKQWIKEAKK